MASWNSGLDNYIVCKRFAVQNLTWSLKFVFLKIFWTWYNPGSNSVRSIAIVFVTRKFSLSSINLKVTPLHDATPPICMEFGCLKNSDSQWSGFFTGIRHKVHLIKNNQNEHNVRFCRKTVSYRRLAVKCNPLLRY